MALNPFKKTDPMDDEPDPTGRDTRRGLDPEATAAEQRYQDATSDDRSERQTAAEEEYLDTRDSDFARPDDAQAIGRDRDDRLVDPRDDARVAAEDADLADRGRPAGLADRDGAAGTHEFDRPGPDADPPVGGAQGAHAADPVPEPRDQRTTDSQDQRLYRDETAPVVTPAPASGTGPSSGTGAVAAGAVGAAALAPRDRDRRPDVTLADSDDLADASDPDQLERERLARERAARKEARDAALAPAPQQPAPEPVPVQPAKKTTDRFFASLGLFLLRLVVAAIMGVHGVNKLRNQQAAADTFGNTVLPYPQYMALGVGVIEVLIALSLILGLWTRLAGLGVALIGAGALAFVYWGPWNPFQGSGFLGELELLLAVVGLLLLFVGAGAWAIDYALRRRRQRRKEERLARV